jgi:signal transduction histidine kinase
MIALLKILIVEDNPDDADLLQRELTKSGLLFTARIVQAREGFEQALRDFGPDIILSDYALPRFDAVAAFRIKQNVVPHIPFIIVSGTIGDENAVELIKTGITDFVPKDKLFTLSQKIGRALKDTEEKKEKKVNAEKLRVQAAELITANRELVLQNGEKEKRAADLAALSATLKIQQEELWVANEALSALNQHLEKRVFDRTGELEKLNHDLKDLSLSKDKFVAVISHDLRNPLSVLLLASETLSLELNEPRFEHLQPFVKIIHRGSHNILQQLNDLVKWAKSQQEKATLNLEKIELVTAVNDSFELLRPNTVLKSIILENKVSPDISINADAVMLRSILQNLVTNSIKYSLPGGLVIVSARQLDAMTEVCIIDSGIGMDAHTTSSLFSRSNTISATGTSNEIGSGLGLQLVKDFVTQQGGTIRVESEIKKGTRISFTVPAYA